MLVKPVSSKNFQKGMKLEICSDCIGRCKPNHILGTGDGSHASAHQFPSVSLWQIGGGSPFDGRLTGCNPESLTVDHSELCVWTVPH